eukprot:snap_masked-scaffold_34-processed-gene-3.34-mRNA-1 protein AED:1.00 eAED:1.00 QI:0/-1/0/0/-1/1/1/0/90
MQERSVLNDIVLQEILQRKPKNLYSDSIQVDITYGLSNSIFDVVIPVGFDNSLNILNLEYIIVLNENHLEVFKELKNIEMDSAKMNMPEG